MFRELLDRLARRAATAIGGGGVVSGDEMGITIGTLVILAEFVFSTWRARRRAKQAEGG